MKKMMKRMLCALFVCTCIALSAIGAADIAIADRVYLLPDGTTDAPAFARIDYSQDKSKATATVFGIPLKKTDVSELKSARVIPGGQSFGVRLGIRGAIVSGVGTVVTDNGACSPGKDAGLRVNDLITCVNGEEIDNSEGFISAVRGSGGKALDIKYKRGKAEIETKLRPVSDESGVYKAGVWVKDTVAGIGTLTYVTEDGEFGGLGHGICDPLTGEALPFERGEIFDAHITGVKRGRSGDPGELCGYFGKDRKGDVRLNMDTGVFGKMSAIPDGTPIGIALKNKVKEGNVKILCTVDGEGVREYDAQITCSLSRESDTKNFIVRITDKELLAKTGGIVQGMSGSPIIRNGMLIGAITHVLVNDPTRGYGIFIENMLKYSE